MNKLLETFENLFVVNRKETTYKRGFLALALVLIGVAILPAYFKYEDYTYKKYKQEYDFVAELIKEYNGEYSQYPLGESINWDREKNLNIFFTENQFSKNRKLHYLNTDLIKDLKNTKYTYIIDAQQGTIYTREYVIYKFRRWHFAFY